MLTYSQIPALRCHETTALLQYFITSLLNSICLKRAIARLLFCFHPPLFFLGGGASKGRFLVGIQQESRAVSLVNSDLYYYIYSIFFFGGGGASKERVWARTQLVSQGVSSHASQMLHCYTYYIYVGDVYCVCAICTAVSAVYTSSVYMCYVYCGICCVYLLCIYVLYVLQYLLCMYPLYICVPSYYIYYIYVYVGPVLKGHSYKKNVVDIVVEHM